MPYLLTTPQNSFSFISKGQTLLKLFPLLEIGTIDDLKIIAVSLWENERDITTQEIINRFSPNSLLAVRSSSKLEDTLDDSNAGVFLSMTDVEADSAPLSQAIDAVIASYGVHGNQQEVLIQAMVEDVALSGVVLTRDLDTGAPYYVINYDDFSGRTDTVTSGAVSKMIWVHRDNPGALHSPRMQKLVAAVQEIEFITNSHELDIEFCMTPDLSVRILQVRPLAARKAWIIVPDQLIDRKLDEIRREIKKNQAPLPDVLGATTILGEMPDWNPAEMIGNTPRGLALSLYKFLITDKTWSRARAKMGYRNVDRPLLKDFAGRPYIDVRYSLNSFLPADLENECAERLVNFQLERLKENRDQHDKLEFEIAITCLDFAYTERSKVLRKAGFTIPDVNALRVSLHGLTWQALRAGSGGLLQHLSLTDRVLGQRGKNLPDAPLERSRVILEECINFGTLPFAILARHAFIGVSFLRSLIIKNVFSETDIERFMGSIRTVAADLVTDMRAVTSGALQQDKFLIRHGHLRPGTYDILSSRYDEKPGLYFSGHSKHRTYEDTPSSEPFIITPSTKSDVRSLLREFDFNIEPQYLWSYIRTAIAAREKAKFAFSRGISDALVEIGTWGESIGLSREDLSHLDILSIYNYAGDINHLKALVEEGREMHRLTRAIRLPYLIVDSDDIDVISPAPGQATFITNKSVTGPIKHLHTNEAADLEGQIVLIESADPGFDWIFTYNIAGLVTQFGGANSHMAIRCAEFGLPAAIGCAERTFAELLQFSSVELNCAAHKVTGH